MESRCEKYVFPQCKVVMAGGFSWQRNFPRQQCPVQLCYNAVCGHQIKCHQEVYPYCEDPNSKVWLYAAFQLHNELGIFRPSFQKRKTSEGAHSDRKIAKTESKEESSTEAAFFLGVSASPYSDSAFLLDLTKFENICAAPVARLAIATATFWSAGDSPAGNGR